MPRKIIELQETENQLLKGSQADSFNPQTSAKTPVWKAHGPQMKGTHLLIFKCLPKKQEPAGSLPRNGSLVRAIYALSGYLVNTDTNRNHFGILHLTYYARRGTQLRALPSSTLLLQLLGPTAGLGQPVLHDLCSPITIRGQDGQAALSFWAPQVRPLFQDWEMTDITNT